MDTKISNLNVSQLKEFMKFNKKAYPERVNAKKRFQWFFLDNPALEDKENPNVLLYYKGNEIIGQFLLNPFEWHFNGKDYKGYWGVDYYVLKEHRSAGGALLAMKAIRGYKPYFTIGPSEVSKKIHLFFRTKIIGCVNKFIWFRNPFAAFLLAMNILFKKKSDKKFKELEFPLSLYSNGIKFKLVNELSDWNEYHWNNTIEFSRSLEFLRWRFFNSFKKYYFYLINDSTMPAYFVVRKCFWRGLILLVIVDYKIPYGDINSWMSILKTSKLLAKITNCDGVIIMSSHQVFDKELKKNLFIKVGKGSLIITNAKIDVSDKVIQNRNLVYATMADCDLDINLAE